MPDHTAPIRLALVNDYPLVVEGLAAMLSRFSRRVRVVDLEAGSTDIDCPVDLVLYDTFGRDESVLESVRQVLCERTVKKCALYTWVVEPRFAERALASGVDGVISKTLTGEQLVCALEAIDRGEQLVSPSGGFSDRPRSSRRHGCWPGAEAGLTQREAEMLALITQGLTNADIARTAYLSPNSVKSYIRSAYRKIGVVRRSQAVLWGIENGMAKTSPGLAEVSPVSLSPGEGAA